MAQNFLCTLTLNSLNFTLLSKAYLLISITSKSRALQFLKFICKVQLTLPQGFLSSENNLQTQNIFHIFTRFYIRRFQPQIIMIEWFNLCYHSPGLSFRGVSIVIPDLIYMQANTIKNAHPTVWGPYKAICSICQQSLMLILSWVQHLGNRFYAYTLVGRGQKG